MIKKFNIYISLHIFVYFAAKDIKISSLNRDPISITVDFPYLQVLHGFR